MPNDTQFPALDGSSPGESKEVVQNLEDTPLLEPLFPRSEFGISPSQIEGFEPEAEVEPTAPTAPSEAPRRKSVQDRIDRLTKRNHEAKNQNDVQGQQLAALAQQNQLLFAQLMQLRAPQGAPVPASPADPFGTAEPGQPRPAGVDIRQQIADAVRGEVAPISQSIRDLHTGNAIRQAHEASFVEAAEDYPELRDARSEFRKVFNDLYDAAPGQVKALPNAPMHFALQARGILADAKRDTGVKVAQKRAATVHVPTPTATDEPTAGVIPKSVETAAAAAKQRLRDGISTHEDYVLLRRLSQFRQQRQE